MKTKLLLLATILSFTTFAQNKHELGVHWLGLSYAYKQNIKPATNIGARISTLNLYYPFAAKGITATENNERHGELASLSIFIEKDIKQLKLEMGYKYGNMEGATYLNEKKYLNHTLFCGAFIKKNKFIIGTSIGYASNFDENYAIVLSPFILRYEFGKK